MACCHCACMHGNAHRCQSCLIQVYCCAHMRAVVCVCMCVIYVAAAVAAGGPRDARHLRGWVVWVDMHACVCVCGCVRLCAYSCAQCFSTSYPFVSHVPCCPCLRRLCHAHNPQVRLVTIHSMHITTSDYIHWPVFYHVYLYLYIYIFIYIFAGAHRLLCSSTLAPRAALGTRGHPHG